MNEDFHYFFGTRQSESIVFFYFSISFSFNSSFFILLIAGVQCCIQCKFECFVHDYDHRDM